LAIELITGRTGTRVTAEGILAIGRTTRSLQTLVLVDTLAVIHVLDISLRTGTSISSHGVHASGLTSSIVGALVSIEALGAGGVQLESARAHALETAESVDALRRCRAVAGLYQTLVDIDALVVDLRVTVRTGAFVTSGRVDAFVLAVMLSGGAFVEIPA